jgi:hypothetical protein
MPVKHNHTFFSVRPRDHYMPFTKGPFRSVLHSANVSSSKASLPPSGSQV